MSHVWGSASGRDGAFLGDVPQRGGFGRRPVLQPAQTSDGHGLSSAAQQFLAQERLKTAPVTSEIDYVICGGDIQHIEITLDPGGAVIAENGAMIWKDSDIDLSLVMGDGRNDDANFITKMVNAGSNLMAGESAFMSEFKHVGSGKATIALGGKVPGHIVPVRLEQVGGGLVCAQNSFLAAMKGVAIGASLQRDLTSGLWGGEDFIMQTLSGRGWAFLHIGGTLIERELAPGQRMQVDSGCVAAHEPSVEMDIRYVGGVTTAIAGGEGLFFTEMKGPGKVWIQSLPFQRIANETARASQTALAPQVGHAIAEVSLKEGMSALKSFW
jgi:uncharacterized protein (AIM24 family)